MNDAERIVLALRRMADRLYTYESDERERWLSSVLDELATEIERTCL